MHRSANGMPKMTRENQKLVLALALLPLVYLFALAGLKIIAVPLFIAAWLCSNLKSKPAVNHKASRYGFFSRRKFHFKE